jgi:hypothetical protein
MSGVKPDQSVIEYQNACTNGHTTNPRKSASGSPRKTSMKLTRSNVSGRRELRRGGAALASVVGTSVESIT